MAALRRGIQPRTPSLEELTNNNAVARSLLLALIGFRQRAGDVSQSVNTPDEAGGERRGELRYIKHTWRAQSQKEALGGHTGTGEGTHSAQTFFTFVYLYLTVATSRI